MFDKITKLHDAGLAKETFRYFVATAISACLSVLLPVSLHEIVGWSEEVAVGAGLIVVMLINFVVIRTYVFRSSGHIGRQMLGFIASSGVFRLGEYGLFLLFHQVLGVYF